jgi:cytosine deaminase
MTKLASLPCGIKVTDKVPMILAKLEKLLVNYKPDPNFSDDVYAKASNIEALKSVKKGGYGIGAVIVDAKGRILHRAANAQLTKLRSDLHGEMNLLNEFESMPQFKKYRQGYVLKPGLMVFSSAEPCPMCFIRLSTVGVDTRYSTPGPDDGMVNRVACLPKYWQELAQQHKFEQGRCSPLMQKVSHVLFFTYMLDNRHP